MHRVGRTARMTTEGDALLFLMPHEEPYLDILGEHNVKLRTMGEHEVRAFFFFGVYTCIFGYDFGRT